MPSKSDIVRNNCLWYVEKPCCITSCHPALSFPSLRKEMDVAFAGPRLIKLVVGVGVNMDARSQGTMCARRFPESDRP